MRLLSFIPLEVDSKPNLLSIAGKATENTNDNVLKTTNSRFIQESEIDFEDVLFYHYKHNPQDKGKNIEISEIKDGSVRYNPYKSFHFLYICSTKEKIYLTPSWRI